MTPAKTEQFLTVVERQGPKTWRWHLKSLNLTPRVGDDGAVGFIRNGRLMSDVAYIEPVRILDELGQDVTPDDARWSVAAKRRPLVPRARARRRHAPHPLRDRPGDLRTARSASLPRTTPQPPKSSRSPAGVVNGDVLIAQLTMRGDTTIFGIAGNPGGGGAFTSIDRQDSGDTRCAGGLLPASRDGEPRDVVHVHPERERQDLCRHRRLRRRGEPGQPDQHQRRPGERLERHCHRPHRRRRRSPTRGCSRSSAPRPATERRRTGRD